VIGAKLGTASHSPRWNKCRHVPRRRSPMSRYKGSMANLDTALIWGGLAVTAIAFLFLVVLLA
jgi:hypothetical protein